MLQKIRNIISFESFERDLLKQVIKSKDKWLVFVKSIPQGKDIYNQLSKVLGEKMKSYFWIENLLMEELKSKREHLKF